VSQLYDLEADPGESTNLAEREPALRAELSDALRAWEESQPCPTH
jgi:hypothetical protein